MKLENVIIKKINETEAVGTNNFLVRKIWVQTQEQYPQTLEVQFTQNNCVVLDNFAEGQVVDISINLRGREWTNKEGKTMVFNSINGWLIIPSQDKTNSTADANNSNDDKSVGKDGLPF